MGIAGLASSLPAARTPDQESRPVTTFDVDAIRAEFPALALEQDGRLVAYFDGPGGTQVPQRVIDAIATYYRSSNANEGGAFATSERSDASTADAHAAVADFVGAGSADEIKFGANMTTLTFHVSRSLGAMFGPGDEIVVTTLDHEANVSPWRRLAEDRGLVVRTVDIRPDDVTLDLEGLEAALGPRTRIVAVGYASNAVGTINPVREIVARAHEVGALTWIDAVHYAPHGPIDVRELGTDFLVTSVYKWFGPHLGALYGRAEILDRLPTYKVRPAHDHVETGTQNFEAIAGAGAAVEYLASLGTRFGGNGKPISRRQQIVAGMRAIQAWEAELADRLLRGLGAIPGVRIHGIADPARIVERTPTVAVTIDGTTPRAAAEALGQQGMFTWDGDFYAQALIERLGLFETGGVLRLGLVHYNTPAEIDRLLEALERIAVEAAGARKHSTGPG
jgi:cysteine desulfurase family protein (TIGR01976 family)